MGEDLHLLPDADGAASMVAGSPVPLLYLTPPQGEGHLARRAIGVLLQQNELQRRLGKESWSLRLVTRSMNLDFFGGAEPTRARMLTLLGTKAGFSDADVAAYIRAGWEANQKFISRAEEADLHPTIYSSLLNAMATVRRSQNMILPYAAALGGGDVRRIVEEFIPPVIPKFDSTQFEAAGEQATAPLQGPVGHRIHKDLLLQASVWEQQNRAENLMRQMLSLQHQSTFGTSSRAPARSYLLDY